jgi:hypothetical protein
MTRPWHVELDAILQLTPRGEIAIPMPVISHAVRHLSIAGVPSGLNTRLSIVIQVSYRHPPSVSRRFGSSHHDVLAGKSDLDTGQRGDE